MLVGFPMVEDGPFGTRHSSTDQALGCTSIEERIELGVFLLVHSLQPDVALVAPSVTAVSIPLLWLLRFF
ncbi:hypothetical protein NQ317_004912 [Molorchus minor]|uniref:Uncharacterized protein n=1 Tax=Molorchus minor TaxID=1323400 RepID=A0ABQ9JI73_9CUCU|nr:hypothetical protein NQ317_004912 [Molorchus minor]